MNWRKLISKKMILYRDWFNWTNVIKAPSNAILDTTFWDTPHLEEERFYVYTEEFIYISMCESTTPGAYVLVVPRNPNG